MVDISQIGEMLGLASSAVGVTDKATTTIGNIKDLLGKQKPAENGEISQLLNTLAADLTSANVMNLRLSEALKALSNELQRQNEFETRRSRYALYRTEEDDLVYKLIEDEHSAEPVHFICPVCLNSEQVFSFVTGNGDYKFCQARKEHMFQFHRSAPPRRKDRSRISI